MTKNILLCADDYSQNEAICTAILLLAKQGRINAISCLVNLPDWQDCYKALKPLSNSNYLGLHLNLSFGQALSMRWQGHYGAHFAKLPTLIKESYLGRLDRHCLEAEIAAQFDAFTERMGQHPDFIDGHQHVHQLPMVREALVAVYKQRHLTAFCRNTHHRWQDFLSGLLCPKSLAISLLGGQALNHLLRQHSIPSNSSFAGSYHFRKAKNYRSYFKKFLRLIHSGGLILCHPGLNGVDRSDPLYQYRPHEFDYLMSSAFLSDLEEAQCRLAALKRPS